MASMKALVLAVTAFAAVSVFPLAAQAIEVECEFEDGSTCTVGNDRDDFASCVCADDSSTGGHPPLAPVC